MSKPEARLGVNPFKLATNGTAVPAATSLTITEAMDKYLTHLAAADRSPRTLRAYRTHWQSLLAYPEIQPDMSIADITPELLDRWAASLRAPGVYANNHYRRAEERPLSDSSRLAYIQSVKSLLAFCWRRGYLERDPAADLRRPRINHSARNKVMSVQDLYRMLDVAQAAAADGRPRDLALLMFMADTGCRRGEAANLRLRDLHLADLEAHVTGKTGERLVDYTHKTADALAIWQAMRGEHSHDYVFTGQGIRNSGKPLGGDAIDSIFKRLASRAGVRGRANPQALRHLVGQSWTDAVNLELVRMKLGHASVTTTAMFYAHQDTSRVKAATQLHSLLNRWE